ncbi:MAG: GntR family transcriptional regulator [Spirochaetota bacterium]|jgi:DNA-binding GntR family transcriptional regulator|nr:GntR family transcriptional regulator [Spirochaetota bacterium]HOQ93985.1 GntR family transcriptional regulator [Sphaerochaeta sp.]HPK47889.1 GntR family transcriptional regulator [Sphaerochaeta sp.]
MPPFTRTTVSEEIYHTLRMEILCLRFKPGEELNLQLLGEQLQVSRSPVRDALMRLAGDNLVDIFPQRGTRVSLINLKQVEEERFLRKSLEESAVKKFMYQGREEDWQAMERAIADQVAAMEKSDFVAFLEADDAFHQVIFEAIGMGRIWRIIKAQGGNHHRIRLLSFYEKNVIANIIDEHRRMLAALQAKQMDTVLALQNNHLSKLLQETESIVARYPNYFTKQAAPRLGSAAHRSTP